MKISGTVKKIVFPTQVLLLVLLCGFWATGAWATEKEEDGKGAATEGMISQRNYASLPNLVAMVGSDAMAHLHGFFAAEPVTIEPFIVLSEFSTRQRVSLLGATLAEQMAAVIGNESLAMWRSPSAGEHEQRVSGILQEVNGYLRIHIIAANTRGDRRSYVVNVEMSEPIYRALHSYVYMQ
ncbi:MAG: hypothetical protein L6364_04595 [Desulfobulbaceae bacterium]|nr:hypothetical protein [Pseudomonadota bacterium]MCG2822953.1 hypothetical protein [Desulfobulbaceae bacterium]MDP2003966.1 hypothetical protein [Desulfurivibrionaceae bacterium]